MIKLSIMLTDMPEVEWNRYMRSHKSVYIHGEFAYLSGRTKSHFLKTEIYFDKKTTPQLLEHIGLQNMKVGGKTNFGRLATIFQICSMDADVLS